MPALNAAGGRDGHPRGWSRALVAWLAIGFAFAAAFLIGLAEFARRAPKVADDLSAPAVVALTGGGGARIRAAGALLSGDPKRRLLISGVHAGTGAPDLAAMTALPPEAFAARVEIGRRATNTAGNARETAAWVARHGFEAIIVVTSDYHMPRALLEFGQVMPSVRFAPYPVGVEGARLRDWWRDPRAFRRVAPEFLKYLVMWTRVRVAGITARLFIQSAPDA